MTLDDILQPNMAFTLFKKRLHVRAIVDDQQVVVRRWSRGKQSWIYEVEDRYYYELAYREGTIQKVTTDRD